MVEGSVAVSGGNGTRKNELNCLPIKGFLTASVYAEYMSFNLCTEAYLMVRGSTAFCFGLKLVYFISFYFYCDPPLIELNN